MPRKFYNLIITNNYFCKFQILNNLNNLILKKIILKKIKSQINIVDRKYLKIITTFIKKPLWYAFYVPMH